MGDDDIGPDPMGRRCWLKIVASCGVALLAIAASAENLEKYLVLPGSVWIIFGTFVAGIWAYEIYCRGSKHDDEKA
jgi:hypothetical protein